METQAQIMHEDYGMSHNPDGTRVGRTPIPDGATVAMNTLTLLQEIKEQNEQILHVLTPVAEIFEALKSHPMLKSFL